MLDNYYDNVGRKSIFPQTWEERIADDVNTVWDKVLTNATPANNARAFIIGGQPGAGKSYSIKSVFKQSANNAIIISLDDYRELHPVFEKICAEQGKNFANYTRHYASMIASKLFERAVEHKLNIIYESTLGNYERVSKLLATLQANKYECNIIVVACPAQESYESTKKRMDDAVRAGDPPRGVPTDVHDEIVKKLAVNVQKLIDNFKDVFVIIQTRIGEELWNNQDARSASEVLKVALKYDDHRKIIDARNKVET